MYLNKDIDEIKEKRLKEIKDTELGKDLTNLIKILRDSIFINPQHFILEIIQNIEDSFTMLENEGILKDGYVKIDLYSDRLTITHNGKQFTKSDVEAICGIRSNKKPEKGFLGYLGIGFKSVFKVTDSPNIISNGYCFKFDKNEWDEPDNIPWEIIPISMKCIPEKIEKDETMFIIPFKDKYSFDIVKKELDRLDYYLMLFLKKIKKIEVHDHVNNQDKIVKWNKTKKDTLNDKCIDILEADAIINNTVSSFLIFSKVFEVPDKVRQDEITISAKRNNVKKREVSIAFQLESNGDLKAFEGEAYGGLFSFLPLEEVKTGLKFLIQADFIVQAGRETLNYNAEWNKWLVRNIAELAVNAADYFAHNPRYCTQYIELFEYEVRYDEVWLNLLRPYLINELDNILRDPLIGTIDNGLIPLSKAVKLDDVAIKLFEKGFITMDDIEFIFGKGHKLIPVNARTGNRSIKLLRLKDMAA